MSGSDCVDVCDEVISMMCFQCPHYHTVCMPVEDEANHEQMLMCMGEMKDRLNGKFPTEDEIDYPYEE